MHRLRVVPLMVAALLAGCDGRSPAEPGDFTGSQTTTAWLRVLHAVAAVPRVDVLLDNEVLIAGLALGEIRVADVPAGSSELVFRPAGGAAPPVAHAMTFVVVSPTTVFTVDSSSIINPWVLTDSGAVVPAGRSKLRVAHVAASAPPVHIWRTQPDFGTYVTLQFPFRYQEASPYIESGAGNWQVLVSTEEYGGAGPTRSDTLLESDPLMIPSGESRTVVILDADGGGLSWFVLTP